MDRRGLLALLLIAAAALSVSGEAESTSETALPTEASKSPDRDKNETTTMSVIKDVSTTPVAAEFTTQSDETTENNTEGVQQTNITSEVTSPSTLDTTTPVVPSTTVTATTVASVESITDEQLPFINILDEEIEKDVNTTPQPTTTISSDIEPTTVDLKTRRERLSDQIRSVIKHYKDFGTVTIPDASVPDPMAIPNARHNIGGSEVDFTNTRVYGLSNFTIQHINTDLNKMQVYVGIYIRRLIILGNYTAKTFFRKMSGPFNVTLLYVEASGAAALVREKDGNLQASESEMDMTFMESRVKFGNMGLMGTFLQGIVTSAGPLLFESIKPLVLKEINIKVREGVNKKIKTIGSKFLESGTKPPIDVALDEGRRYVRENGYDPYFIENYVWRYVPKNQSIFRVNISRLSISGLSNFRRIGDVSLSMDSGTIQIGIHLATSKLKGKCSWSFALGKFVRSGHTNFTVDYVQGRGLVNQSLDVSEHPVLEDLDVNVGRVRIQMKGTGPLDFILEAVVNTLPDLIRHIIVDAIELPLKYGMQQLLSEINVEEILDRQLPELDKMGL